jgi:7-cyano-7-deazaguanine synthase
MDVTPVVIYSGGMDSFTLLYYLLEKRYRNVLPLTFDYGQRHKVEINYAIGVCRDLGLDHMVVDLGRVSELLGGSALTSPDVDVPEGHYEEESMKATVVPNRNMIMLSLAVGYAVSKGTSLVFYGAHSGDHAIYPDCRPLFVEKMNEVTQIANYLPVSIKTPFLGMSKGEILTIGMEMGLDYSRTWTCYKGHGVLACGKCGACQERLEAFEQNEATDPLEYE